MSSKNANKTKNKITNKKDKIFRTKNKTSKQHKTKQTKEKFCFDKRVASVFDDMLERSIPYYKDNLKLCIDFIIQNLPKSSKTLKTTKSSKNLPRIYDIGCSTGNMLLGLFARTDAEFIGIDSSSAMIENATLKAKAYGAKICFICADCTKLEYQKAQCFITNYTLQFIRPPKRVDFLSKIYDALESGGILILSEKMTSPNATLEAQMIEYYHSYKAKNGYTKNEINAKREALENVLVPYSLQENIALLCEAGFRLENIEVLFKWVNFGTIIAKKD
ncbi:carboxy-S-adenosyl-L-methionine synthase CmoA [Helicobacter sp. T3_23-1056]